MQKKLQSFSETETTIPINATYEVNIKLKKNFFRVQLHTEQQLLQLQLLSNLEGCCSRIYLLPVCAVIESTKYSCHILS